MGPDCAFAQPFQRLRVTVREPGRWPVYFTGRPLGVYGGQGGLGAGPEARPRPDTCQDGQVLHTGQGLAWSPSRLPACSLPALWGTLPVLASDW